MKSSKLWQRFLSMTLAMCMIVSIMPMSAFGEGAASSTPSGTEQTQEVAAQDVPAPSDDVAVHTLTINYEYTDSTLAANPYTASLASGDSYAVDSPAVTGYAPDQASVSGVMADADVVVTVTYTGTEVSYTVSHKFEQPDGTFTAENETKSGNVGEETAAAAQQRDGYTSQAFDQAEIAAQGTVVVIEYLLNDQTVRFVSNGGSYVTTQEMKYGAKATMPTAPTRTGYVFSGWYTDSDCTTLYAFDQPVTANLTLYAAWAPDTSMTADYTVVYWMQKADDAGAYDFVYSTTVSGAKVGSEISEVAAFDNSKLPAGFDAAGYDTTPEILGTDKTVAADGSTVVNVRYDRKEFSLLFNVEETTRVWVPRHWDGKHWVSGRYEDQTQWVQKDNLTITARYGQDISALWTDAAHSSYFWSTSKNGDKYYSLVFTMPLNGFTCYGKGKSGNQNVIYYTQNLTNPNVNNLTGYTEYSRIDGIEFSNLTVEDQMPIEGFTYKYWVQPFERDGDGHLYYTRNSYTVSYNTNGGTGSMANRTFKFQAALTTPGTAPTRAGYRFTGWYYDTAGQQKVQSTDTMPAHNLILYAGWETMTYTVSFNPQGGTTVTPQQIAYQGTVTYPEAPSYDGHVFTGWYADEACTTRYDFEAPVSGDVTLYAGWKASTIASYTVHYVDENGKDLHDSLTVTNQKVGKSVTVKAIAIDGYAPDQASKSAVLKAGSNDITFTYTTVSEQSYTVHYYKANTTESVLNDKTASSNYSAVTEVAPSVSGYALALGQASRKTLVLSRNTAENVIIFYYDALYTVTYKLSGGNINSSTADVVNRNVRSGAATPTCAQPVREGFTFMGWTPAAAASVTENATYTAQWKRTFDQVAVNGYEGIYDGNAHSVTVSGNLAGDTVSYSTDNASWSNTAPGFTDAGEHTVYVKFANGSDTTTKSAAVKITPVELTITADSAVQIYNGMALTKNSYSITAGKFVGSEGFASVTVEGSQTMAGSSKNEITDYTFAAGTNKDNYLVHCDEGVLEVTKASIAITVKAADATWTYDGNAHSTDAATLTEGTLANGDTLVCTVSGSITDAGSVTNTLSSVKVMHGDTDVTENYDVTKENGTLTVNPVAITLKANSASRAYNGEALTDSGYQITGGAFVGEDGLATVTVKGSQTMEGSSENVITGHTLSTATNAANYKIGYESGLLTVTAPQAKTITIRTASDSKTYDGTALVNHGYTYTDHVLATGDVLYVTMGTSITNAGTAKNTVASHKVMHGDVDVSRYYTIKVEEGTLTVSPAKITLTSETKTQEYNGSALTAPNVTATGDGFAAGEGFAALTATGSQTIVGSSENSISYALTEKTLASNYEITPKPGTLTVTQNTATITATAASTHKTYDGTALTLDTATVTGLPEGFTATFTMKAESTITNAGDKANEIDTVVIKNANGEDVTAYFQNITKVNGTLTVTKATVTLGTASAEKQYDGTALTKTDATTQTGFVKGEGVVITATGRQTVPGSSNNTFTYAATENTNLSNYTVIPAYGTLTVTKNTTLITITAGSASRLYDGTALTNGTATVTGLPEGFTATYTITADSTITNVGTHANAIDKADIRLSGSAVTDYFSNINLVGGTLQVTPRTIMLGSDTATKEYDGTPLTAPTVSVTGDGFAKNEGFVADNLKATGTQTELGKCINTIAYALNSKTSAGNYTISTNPGELSVTKNTKTITITAADAEKSYDGTPLTATGYTYTQGILANGDVLTATTSGTITDAGKTANTITGYHITRADGTAVTGYYTLATKTGTLTVSAQKIVLQAASDSKPYDGNPLTKNGFAVVSGTFADGQGVESVVTKGSQEMVGSSANTITSHTLKAGTDAKNYEISYLPGTLSVTNENPIALTVSADSGTFTYDGTAHSKATATITAGMLASGDTLHYTVTGSITNAGETANVISDITVLHGDTDVTANYAIAPANGTLTVEKAKATVSTKNASKVYDGTALTQTDTVQTGFAKGEGVTFDITGIQLFAGSSDNSFTYAANEGTNLANYEISENVGTLTVLKASIRISVSAASENYTYDGTTHSNSSVIVTGTFASGDTLNASASGSIRNAGKATNELGTVTVMHGTTDVTENYAITASNGSLVVNPKTATITLKNAEQEYDGTPLTSNNFTTDGFIEADAVASVTASGSQTVAGSTRNTIVSHTLRDGVLTGNYKIGYEAADLTVLPKAAPITLTAANAEKVYDGTALTTPNFTYTADVLVEGDTLYAAVTGSRTNVGSTNSSIETFSVKNAAGKDVTACYTFADPMTGTLTVTPKAVTVTGAVGSFTYNGAAHTVSGGSVTGLIDGQTMNASISSVSRTEIGTSYMGLAGAVYQVVIGNATGAIENGEVCEFIDNYTLTITDGSITINAAAVTPVDPDTTPTDPDTTPTRPTTPVRPTTPGTTETIDDTTTGTTETITDTETPLGEGTAPENIEDADVPLAAAGAWALLNLLFTIATAIGSILLLITSFTRRANDKDDAKESKQNAETSDKETSRGDVNRHGVWRVLSVILTIVSVIVFIVTENMALPMVLLDKWTLIMALFTLVQILNMFLSQKSYSKDRNRKDGAAGAEG